MSGDRGGALLEVLVALVILATAGSALVVLVADGQRAVGRAYEQERRLVRADRVLSRLALRDRRGLDLRLGRRSDGGFVTEVMRPRPDLYRLAVSDSSTPDQPLVVTVVHRPEAP